MSAADALSDEEVARITAAAEELAATFPPLTEAQANKVAALLAGVDLRDKPRAAVR